MTISIPTVPASTRKPGVYSELNFNAGISTLPQNPQILYLLGQKTSAGTATAEVPLKVFSTEEIQTAAGVGSVLDLAGAAALKANPNMQMYIVPIDDNVAGVAATGTILVSGVATSTGTFDIWIGNVLIQVAVTSGDAVNDIAAAIDTAIQAKEEFLPVTSGVSTATVTLTARNDGTLANNIPVSFKNNDIGTTDLTVTQIGGVIAGSGDPDITNALTAIFPADLDLIVCCNNDATNLGLLKTHLNSRSTATEKRRAMGVYGYTGVQATIETLAGTTLNEKRMTVGYRKYTKTTERGHSLDYEVAGAYGAVIASQEDPALPYNGVLLNGIAPPNLENRYSRSQEESMLLNGVTPLRKTSSEEVVISRAITNNTTNAAGFPTADTLDITTIRSLDFGASAIERREGTVFQQSKKDDDSADKVRTQILDVMRLLGDAKIWLKPGPYADGVIVETDIQDSTRFNTQIPGPVVPGLHIIANQINLVL